MRLHMNQKTREACNLKCTVEIEGPFKVTSGQIHCRSSSILETVQDKDVISTGHQMAAILMMVSVLIANFLLRATAYML